jgi:hypothetical protein
VTVARLHERSDGAGRVDRDRGVIYGVKVVGRRSPNTHGVRGANGTEYTIEALRGELRLVEGFKVNIDHPARHQSGAERSAQDRVGKLVNARLRPDGIYADLHLLKSHPMTPRVIEAAETSPDLFALSHNATGEGEVREGKYTITAITSLVSVDLVADGGSNRSLFEHGAPLREGRDAAPVWSSRQWMAYLRRRPRPAFTPAATWFVPWHELPRRAPAPDWL